MASANMKDIKRRIKSVESTMQITKAMELVASSKLRKAKQKADRARPFFDALYASMYHIMTDNRDFTSVYTRKRQVKSAMIMVVAGDRGLAGGFNSNVLKPAYKRAQELQKSGVKVGMFCIGKKAVEFFEKREFPILQSYMNIGEIMTIYYSLSITDSVSRMFREGEIDSVELYYTTFLNALSQKEKHVEILPVGQLEKKDSSGEEKAHVLIEYDPSPEAVFDDLVPKYLSGLLFGAVVDSFAAEQASRRTAMESATDNAGEMISSLSLMYNRARQAAITQEITEIVSGSQALSS